MKQSQTQNTDLFQVRFNGNIVFETPYRGDAEDRFASLVSRNPTCECAIILNRLDSNGDEIKYEAYSG